MGKMDNCTWADLSLQCDWIELLRLCFKMFQEVLSIVNVIIPLHVSLAFIVDGKYTL